MYCPQCKTEMELIGAFYWHKNKTKKCPITSIPKTAVKQVQQGSKIRPKKLLRRIRGGSNV